MTGRTCTSLAGASRAARSRRSEARFVVPWAAIGFGAIAAGLSMSSPVAEAWQFSRSAILAGEWWRCITGHFTHWTVSHLAWDMAAFVVCGAFLERRSRIRFVVTVMMAGAGVAISLLALAPHLEYYRGLSGIAAAVFVQLALELLAAARKSGSRVSSMLPVGVLLGFAVKIAFELLESQTVLVDAGATVVVVPLAHLSGGVLGFCGWMFSRRCLMPRFSPPGNAAKASKLPDYGASRITSDTP